MRTRVIIMGLCLLLAVPVGAQSDRGTRISKKEMVSEQRVALVIGNAAYASSPLRNPANDARKMAEALRACRFEVVERIDCDRREMRQAIREFGNRIKQGGVGLFYYAGHGMQIKGTNYLIPVGVDVQVEEDVVDECIEVSSVLRRMDSAGNRVNIVVMDACRDNPFARSFRSTSRGLAKMDAPVGSYLAYATAPGSVAADGEGANGLYTSKLLEHIRNPGVKIEEMFKGVRQDVYRESSGAQTPWAASSLMGEFYFVLPDLGGGTMGDSGMTEQYQTQADQYDAQAKKLKAELEAEKRRLAEEEAARAEMERKRRDAEALQKELEELRRERKKAQTAIRIQGSPKNKTATGEEIVEYWALEQKPDLVKQITPKYPEVARKAGLEGVVFIQFTVGSDGRVKTASVVRGPEIFRKAALNAVYQFVFKPGIQNGKPVSVRMSMPVRFRLSDTK